MMSKRSICPPVPLQCPLGVDTRRARLDQRPVTHAHHQLVTQSRRQLAQPDQRDHRDDEPDDAADVELVAPVGMRRQCVAGYLGDDEAAQNRPEGPEAHRRAPPHLRREVADQRGCRDQRDPLDQAHQGEQDRVRRLVVRVRDREQDEQSGDEDAADDEVRASPAVGEAGEQRREGADGVTDDGDEDELREAEVQLFDDLGRDRALHVELVVENDRCENSDREVGRAWSGVGIVRKLPVPQPAHATRSRAVDGCRRHQCHSFVPNFAAVT
jgi:hypothetical protein